MLWEANIAYILEGSKTDYNLNGLETGTLGSCFNLGMLIGTMLWGMIADRYGRMYAFKSTVCISAFFSLLLTFSVNYYMTGACLLMIGVGIGGELSLGGTVFYEFCPPSKAYYLTQMGIFWVIGGVISALIALVAILVNDTGVSTWRFIVGISFVIEAVCAGFRVLLDETPAFWENSGQGERLEQVLNKIAKTNKRKRLIIGESINDSRQDISDTEIVNLTGDSWVLVKRLHSNYLRLVMVFGIVINKQIYFSASFAETSMLFFMPAFLENLSTPVVYGIILIQQFCGIPGILLGSWMVETSFGRRKTILFSFFLSGILCFLFYIQSNLISVYAI